MAGRKGYQRRHRESHFGFLYRVLIMLLICACLVAAVTLFFRVNTIQVTGQRRYTEAEIIEASGVEPGDNLYLLNKNRAAGRILEALPYIETVHPYRRLPDTLVIEVQECGETLALEQSGAVWLFTSAGKIVDRVESAEGCCVVSGLEALSPSVGTYLAVGVENETQLESLLALAKAIEESDKLADVQTIQMDDPAAIRVDYLDRFTLRLAYGANYAYKLKTLDAILESGKIQENMTGTFDMRGEEGKTNFIQNVR